MARLDDSTVVKFATLFAGRTDAAGRLKSNGTSYQEKVTVDESTYRAHLEGARWPQSSLGVYPLTDDGLVRWGACDIDDGVEASAWLVADRFVAHGVTPYVEVSKGKGHHVWCFMEEPVAGFAMRAFLRRCATEAQVAAETFPKQDALTAASRFGNFIHLPYPGHPEAEGGRYFIGRDGRQFELPAFLERVQLSRLPTWALERPQLPQVRTDRLLHGTYGGERAACIAACLDGTVREGHRDEALIRVAGYLVNTEHAPDAEHLIIDAGRRWGLSEPQARAKYRSAVQSGKWYGCDLKREIPEMAAACTWEACPFHRSADRVRAGATFRIARPKGEPIAPDLPAGPADPSPDELLATIAPHGFLRHYVEYCTSLSDAPPVGHLAAALVLVAVALGNHVQALSFGGNYIRPNLWVTFIAPSGARKSSIMSRAVSFLLRMPAAGSLLLSHTGSKEAWFDQLQHNPTRLLHADEFVGLLAQLDRKHMASAREFLTALFSQNRVTDSSRTHGDGVVINPALSIIAGCTPTDLENFARREDFATGFLARFLFLPASQEAPAPRRIPRPRLDVEAALVQRLSWISTLTGEITFDDALNERLCAWADAFKQIERNAAGEAIGQLNRAFDFAIKLAMVMQVAETEPGAALWRDLDPDVVERAIRLTEWLIRRTMHMVNHQLASGEHERNVRAMLRAVERAGGAIRQRELRRAVRHLNERQFDEIVQQLIRGGELEAEEERTQGRSAQSYAIPGHKPPSDHLRPSSDHGENGHRDTGNGAYDTYDRVIPIPIKPAPVPEPVRNLRS